METQQALLPKDSGILGFIACIFDWEVQSTCLPPILDSGGISARLNGILVPFFTTFGSSSSVRYRDWETDRKSTRLNSSHLKLSRMPSSA